MWQRNFWQQNSIVGLYNVHTSGIIELMVTQFPCVTSQRHNVSKLLRLNLAKRTLTVLEGFVTASHSGLI